MSERERDQVQTLESKGVLREDPRTVLEPEFLEPGRHGVLSSHEVRYAISSKEQNDRARLFGPLAVRGTPEEARHEHAP